MTDVSVVIPVKDAGPLFERVLDGVRSQGPVASWPAPRAPR